MQTVEQIDLDLVQLGEPVEPCIYQPAPHDREATWLLVMSSDCFCAPSGTPICDDCKIVVDEYLTYDGGKDWICNRCGVWMDVVDLRKINK